MDLAERYVRLAHGINTHQDGLIDSYIGPPEWSQSPQTDLATLETEAVGLEEAVGAHPDAARRRFLSAQVRAMQTVLRRLRGEVMSYTEEVQGLYDIAPERTSETVFESALARLEALLPGSGSVLERLEVARERFRVPPEHLAELLEIIASELRARTRSWFPLPDTESIELKLVRDKPWGGYNWYLGAGRSRVEINTDLPAYLYALPELIAHEGYPGHHTERVFKDQLYRVRGQAEFSLQLLYSPEAVLAEGIATNALEVIAPEDLPAWLSELGARAGLRVSTAELEEFITLNRAFQELDGAAGNASIMLLEDGTSETETLEYLAHYALATPERARKRVDFIRAYRGYIFTYSVGYRLVRDALRAGRANEVFSELLMEPVTPGQLRDMAAD